MKLIGNLLWLFLAGIWMAFAYVMAGIVNCLFIITVPLGVQSFKMAAYAIWPFGRTVVKRADSSTALGCVGNVIWFCCGGLWLALGHLITGALLCLTIIGIPFGIASFKLAGLALAPFGKAIVPIASLSGAQLANAPVFKELGD